MAFTEFATGDAMTRKAWSEQLMRETFGKMGISSLIGTKAGACIKLLTDLDRSAGDTVYYNLLAQDRSAGVNGDSRLKGFEAPLTYYQDTLKINQKRHAHAFKGMSQQRFTSSMRDDARFSLSSWFAWFFEAGLFAHFAGVSGDGNESAFSALGATTAGSDFAGNTVTALDTAHLVDNGGSDFELGMIDDAVAKAKVTNPRVAPLNIGGKEMYVAYLHPYQVRTARKDTAATGWNAIQQNAGVRGESNPIFTNSLGVYNNVILRESEFIPSVGTVRHGVLLGQGAGTIAFGNAWKRSSRAAAGGGTFFSWHEEMDDFDNEEAIAGSTITGFKRAQFNSAAFGVIGLRSTDAAP